MCFEAIALSRVKDAKEAEKSIVFTVRFYFQLTRAMRKDYKARKRNGKNISKGTHGQE